MTLLYPQGFINAHTVRLFEGAIQKAVCQQGRFKIVVNCDGPRPTSPAPGLGAMMGAIEEIRGSGGDLRLASLNDTVRNIFEILGFNHLYRIVPVRGGGDRELRRDGGTGSEAA